MDISVLNNFNKRNLYLEPFPHIIINECLSQEVYLELESSINIKKIKTKCPADGAGAYRYRFGKFKREITNNGGLISEFMEYHTSPEFADKVLNIFDSEIKNIYKEFYSTYESKNVFLRGHFPKTCEKKKAVLTDCQVVVHEPLPEDSTTRTVHIDCFKEIYFGLLYMKQHTDISKGGDLDLYRYSETPVKNSERCSVIYGRDYAEYITDSWSEHNKSLYPVFFNSRSNDPESGNIIKSKTIQYKKNNFILALNSKKSIHGVSPRIGAINDRVSINIIGERLGKKSTMFSL